MPVVWCAFGSDGRYRCRLLAVYKCTIDYNAHGTNCKKHRLVTQKVISPVFDASQKMPLHRHLQRSLRRWETAVAALLCHLNSACRARARIKRRDEGEISGLFLVDELLV